MAFLLSGINLTQTKECRWTMVIIVMGCLCPTSLCKRWQCSCIILIRRSLEVVQRWCQEEANGILCINGRMKIRGKVDVFGFRCAGNSPRPMFSRGDVLMYRLNTWHRGTPVHPGHVRYTHNLLFKRADNKDIQIWNRGFTQKMYSDHLERFIGTLEPDQLETMGFPTRDSPKWLSTKFCI